MSITFLIKHHHGSGLGRQTKLGKQYLVPVKVIKKRGKNLIVKENDWSPEIEVVEDKVVTR